MNTIMSDFLNSFAASFRPPDPRRKRWLISRVWSNYMRNWLFQNYVVRLEYPVKGGRRLDAAIWSHVKEESEKQQRMDIALEWEWDNRKVANEFPYGDFRKLFEVDSKCGLAIVQTRVDGRRGLTEADETVKNLQYLSKEYMQDSRSVELIEIRRVLHREEECVEFLCYFQDLATSTKQEIARWHFPREPF